MGLNLCKIGDMHMNYIRKPREVIFVEKYLKLCEAIEDDDLLTVMMHTHKGVSPNVIVDMHDQTAFLYAVTWGRKDIVEFYLDNGADVYATGMHGWNALDYTAQGKYTDIAKMICECIKGEEKSIHMFSDALSSFAAENNVEMVTYLLDLGADPMVNSMGSRSAFTTVISSLGRINPSIIMAILHHCPKDKINMYIGAENLSLKKPVADIIRTAFTNVQQ